MGRDPLKMSYAIYHTNIEQLNSQLIIYREAKKNEI